MEGVRTEELNGSNLHKLSKSSYQKRTKTSLTFFTYIISYPLSKVNRLKVPIFGVSNGLLTYYLSVYGVPKIEKEVISFSIVLVSIILLFQKQSGQSKSLSLE